MTSYKNDSAAVQPNFIGHDGKAYAWKDDAPTHLICQHLDSGDYDYSHLKNFDAAVEEVMRGFDLADEAVIEELAISEDEWEEMSEEEKDKKREEAKRQQARASLTEYSRDEVAKMARKNHSIKWAHDYLDILEETE